jgi:hypothetical protein
MSTGTCLFAKTLLSNGCIYLIIKNLLPSRCCFIVCFDVTQQQVYMLQYISPPIQKSKLNSQDLIFHYLIKETGNFGFPLNLLCVHSDTESVNITCVLFYQHSHKVVLGETELEGSVKKDRVFKLHI